VITDKETHKHSFERRALNLETLVKLFNDMSRFTNSKIIVIF